MTHLISYAEGINTIMRMERWKERLRRQAEAIMHLVRADQEGEDDRPEIVLDGEIILTVKK